MNEKKNTLLETVPAASELRKVPGFNPLHYLRQAVSRTGEKVMRLELPYKKLWFRMACPNGRMLLDRLRITDQMAIIEAKVYADKDDPVPLASFTVMRTAKDAPRGQYLRVAQDEALNEALENAGFGIQLCDVAEVSDGSGYGSEIPLPQTESAVQEAAEEASPANAAESHEPPAPAPVSTPDLASETTVEADAGQSEQDVPEESASGDTGTVTQQPVESADAPHAPQKQAGEPESAEEGAADAPEAAGTPSTTSQQEDVEKPEAPEEPEEPEEPEPANGDVPRVYTDDMAVEEILQHMTLEEARKVKVHVGTCKGWTLGEVETDRPSSLRWYLLDHSKVGNVVKAAAKLVWNEIAPNKERYRWSA